MRTHRGAHRTQAPRRKIRERSRVGARTARSRRGQSQRSRAATGGRATRTAHAGAAHGSARDRPYAGALARRRTRDQHDLAHDGAGAARGAPCQGEPFGGACLVGGPAAGAALCRCGVVDPARRGRGRVGAACRSAHHPRQTVSSCRRSCLCTGSADFAARVFSCRHAAREHRYSSVWQAAADLHVPQESSCHAARDVLRSAGRRRCLAERSVRRTRFGHRRALRAQCRQPGFRWQL